MNDVNKQVVINNLELIKFKINELNDVQHELKNNLKDIFLINNDVAYSEQLDLFESNNNNMRDEVIEESIDFISNRT